LGITNTASLSFYGTHLTNSHIKFVVYCNTSTTSGAADGATFVQYMPEGVYTAAVLQKTPIYPTSGYIGTQPTEQLGLQNLLPAGASFTVDSSITPVTNLTAPNINTLYGINSTVPGPGPFAVIPIDNGLPDYGPPINNVMNSSILNVYPGLFYYPRNTTWTQNNFGGAYSAVIGGGSNYKLNSVFFIFTGSLTSAGAVTYSPPDGAAVEITGDTNYEFSIPALAPLVTVSGQVTGAVGGVSVVMAKSDSILGVDGNVIPGLSFQTFVGTDASGNYTLNVLPGYNYHVYYETNPMLIVP
jgi:hypothetical protein